MKASTPITTGCGRERIFEARDLLSVRDELCARIRERRACLQSALQVAGIGLAEALAEAPSSTVQLFFDANERRVGRLHALRMLSQDLALSPFALKTAVSVELSSSQRLHLRRQAHRLNALVQALSSVDAQLSSPSRRASCAMEAR
ncbi:MAG TPA: hypothetical protein VGJ84_13015 [Polyangiaceae bacterium]|jgi:hypothetical protein